MACLKMILAARGEVIPTLSLAQACSSYGGYILNEVDQTIKGLIYAPFVEFVTAQFGMTAKVITNVDASSIHEILTEWDFFIASVHPSIRNPDQIPPCKGGHLVLVRA
jgi:hypothetical protein